MAPTRTAGSDRGDLPEGFARGAVEVAVHATPLSSAKPILELPPSFAALIDCSLKSQSEHKVLIGTNRSTNCADQATKLAVATGQSPHIDSPFDTLCCHLSAWMYGLKPQAAVAPGLARMVHIMAAPVDSYVGWNGERHQVPHINKGISASPHRVQRLALFNRTVCGGVKVAEYLSQEVPECADPNCFPSDIDEGFLCLRMRLTHIFMIDGRPAIDSEPMALQTKSPK